MEVNRVYNTATTIYFPLVDAGTADFESTPVTHATGDATISIDGGSFNNTGSGFSHVGKGIYSLPLTAAETTGGVIVVAIIDQTATKAWEDQCVIVNTNLSGHIEGGQSIIIGEVDTATFTATTTALEGFRLFPNVTEETTADHYNGRLLTFTSGVNLGQQTDITDYVLANSKEKFTYSTLTGAPGDGDRYIIT
jgi:hypothetical protein